MNTEKICYDGLASGQNIRELLSNLDIWFD